MYTFVVNGSGGGQLDCPYSEAIQYGKFLCMKHRARVDIFREKDQVARYTWTTNGAKRMDSYIHDTPLGMDVDSMARDRLKSIRQEHDTPVGSFKSYGEAKSAIEKLKQPLGNIRSKLIYY